MGTWEGLRRSEILERSPEDAAHHQRWEADPTCGPPGGESFADVRTRVVACVHDLAERHAGTSVVVVSHVGPIKALLCAAMDVPLTAARRMFLDSATVSVIDWGADAVDWGVPAVLRLYNAHHHLGWEAAPWMRQFPLRQSLRAACRFAILHQVPLSTWAHECAWRCRACPLDILPERPYRCGG